MLLANRSEPKARERVICQRLAANPDRAKTSALNRTQLRNIPPHEPMALIVRVNTPHCVLGSTLGLEIQYQTPDPTFQARIWDVAREQIRAEGS